MKNKVRVVLTILVAALGFIQTAAEELPAHSMNTRNLIPLYAAMPSSGGEEGNEEGNYFIELPKDQGKDINDGASRAKVTEGDGYTSYTTDGNICVIVKLYDVNVKNCDYILIKFAEPCPSKICAAFWSQGGTDNKEIPEGTTEYKYVFAEDPKCKISNDILPQVTLLTLWNVRTVKIAGIYKHSTVPVDSTENSPVGEAITSLRTTIETANSYTVGSQLGQYGGTSPDSIIKEAEAYIELGDSLVEKIQDYETRIKNCLNSLSLNLPAAGSEIRFYCPALKAYVSAPTGASRMKMVASPDATTTFIYDGKNIISKATNKYITTYVINATEQPDRVLFVNAYGNKPGLYTIEFLGGEKERCIQAEAVGSDCNRHYLSSQDGYTSSTQNATAFEIQLVSGEVTQTVNMTSRIINPSFETGDMTGWVYSAIRGDVDAKSNRDQSYTCTGTDGAYLFNTWYSSDSHLSTTQEHCAYQTLYDMPAGEYRLEVLAATNQKTGVTLFANHFTYDFVPRSKSTLTEHRLTSVYITPEMKSMTVGIRSASWFKCDRFILTYLGETKGYKDYVEKEYADASIMHPVIFDNFDGRTAEGFTYSPAEGAYGTFPSDQGGVKNDGTQVDLSVLQLWTSSSNALGASTISTNYTNLPAGYYKVSSAIRVYDYYGSVNNPAQGLTFFAGDSETSITKGKIPPSGSDKTKAFYGNYAIVTKVTDGNLQTGFRIGENCSFNLLGWQNFCLEYIGTNDPTEEVLNLNLPANEYAAICVPYEITAEYFGPLYNILGVTEGVAQIIPASETSIAAGTPIVVKATGKNPKVSINELQISNTANSILTAWNNTVLVGDFSNYTWTADLVDRTQISGKQLKFYEVDPYDMNFTATMMNRAAQRFWMENENYTTSSSSTITNYLDEPTMNRPDQPNPIVIPVVPNTKAQRLYYSTDSTFAKKASAIVPARTNKVEIYNLIPGLTYYYYVPNTEMKGQFVAEGPLRMIMVGDNVYNVRDLGGKQTVDGRYVRYGKIFRSGELNGGYKATDDELKTLKNLGIGSEIDLRGEIDNGGAGDGISAYGFTKGTGTFYYVGGDHYIADEATKMDTSHSGHEESVKFWREEIEFTVANLEADRGVNFHCRIGADRTGCLSLLLEGLMGVKENDLIRNYEVTSFSTAAGTRLKGNTFDTGLKFIKKYQPAGGTLRDAFDAYATKVLGVKMETIEKLRELMLLDEPEYVGIQDINADATCPASTTIHDLMGRRLKSLQRGINIVGGKKVIVK